MPTSRNNDVRIQFVADSRVLAILESHFAATNTPISSVSDLVRKSLQTFALSVMRDSNIPTKEEAQEVISSLAQHGRGFGRDYNNLKLKEAPQPTPFRKALSEDDEVKIDQILFKFPSLTRDKAIEMLLAARRS
jgi:hypothetical protein